MPRRRHKSKHPSPAPAAAAPAASAPTERKKWVRLGALVIVLAGAAAYCDSLHGEFFFDDQAGILANQSIRSLWPPWGCLRPPSDTGVSSRPIVNLSLAINYALGGENVWGYHLFNTVIHILAALALLGIVRRTLDGGRLGERLAACSTPLSVIVVTIWVLHPLLTESVSCVIQRTESLMGLMYLATLYCAIRAFQGGRRGWYVATTACCAIGMACKEVMVTAPLMVLLYDRALAAGTLREALRRRWKLYLALALTGGVLIASMLTGGRSRAVGFHLGISPTDYLKTQAGVILHYLRLAFWPDDLIVDDNVSIARSLWEYAPQGAIVLLLLAGTAVGIRRNRPWGLLGAWFFLILGPSSSFLPLAAQIAAEHRMYLPLAAIVCGVVVGAFHYGDRLARKPGTTSAARRGLAVTGALLSLAAATALGWLTFERNKDYQTRLSIWTDAVRKQPDNARALVSLGDAMEGAGDIPGAMEKYQEAVRIDANYPDALDHAGTLFMRFGRPREAQPFFERLVMLFPQSASVQNDMGVVLMTLDRTREALPYLRLAVELDGNAFKFHRNLAAGLALQKMPDEAARQYDLAIERAPAEAWLYQEQAKVLADAGRFAEAVGRYQTALRLQPDSPLALKELAWLLATCPAQEVRSGSEAMKIAQKLCALPNGRSADNLATLAAAYAEAGNFELAVQTAQAAVAAASSQPKALQDVFRKQLETYRDNQPLRQPAAATRPDQRKEATTENAKEER